jgi:hypothetical protein
MKIKKIKKDGEVKKIGIRRPRDSNAQPLVPKTNALPLRQGVHRESETKRINIQKTSIPWRSIHMHK